MKGKRRPVLVVATLGLTLALIWLGLRDDPATTACLSVVSKLDTSAVLGMTEADVIALVGSPQESGVVDAQMREDRALGPAHGTPVAIGERYLAYSCTAHAGWFRTDPWYWDILLAFGSDGRCTSVFVHA